MMTGSCRFCGQMQNVEAKTQDEANMTATKRCRCEEGIKGRAKIFITEKIERLGTAPKDETGIIPMEEETIETCQHLARMVIDDKMTGVSLSLNDGTGITIRQTKKGARFTRRKILKVEAE